MGRERGGGERETEFSLEELAPVVARAVLKHKEINLPNVTDFRVIGRVDNRGYVHARVQIEIDSGIVGRVDRMSRKPLNQAVRQISETTE